VPVEKLLPVEKEVAEKLPPPSKVCRNGPILYPVFLLTVTLIGLKAPPGGTTTVSDPVDALTTDAFTPPNDTVLFEVTVLKLLPVITTSVPTPPETGEKELITGTCALSKKGISRLSSRMTVLVFITAVYSRVKRN